MITFPAPPKAFAGIVAALWIGLPAIVAPAKASPFEEAFTAWSAKGTLRIERLSDGTAWVHNPQRAAEHHFPASTFKILHSLIALQTGVVSNEDEIIPWDGVTRDIAVWNKDQSLRDAVRNSSVPAFVEIARRIGVKRLSEQVHRAGYGNQQVGHTTDRFWLRGPLKISADEQIGFLKRLHSRQLPFDPAIQETVIDIITEREGDDWVLRAKTGWEVASNPGIGWFVGWLETPYDNHFFALNIDMVEHQHRMAREAIVLRALSEITGFDIR